MTEFGWRFAGLLRAAGSKQIGQFTKRRPDIDQPESGDGAARVVAGEQRRECPGPFDEVVSLPKGRPGNQHQEQTRFEEERDEKQPSEQGSASRLHLGEPFDLARNVAIAARFGFEFDKHGERAGLLPS